MICLLITIAETFCKAFGICDSFSFIVNREAFGGLLLAESFFELFIIPAYHFYKEIGR